MALEFTDANFKSEVLDSEKVTLIDFWAEWCGPCKQMGPVIDELHEDFGDKAKIGKMDVDNNQAVPMQYKIMGIPTFMIFKGGKLQEKIVGMTSKAKLAEAINKAMTA